MEGGEVFLVVEADLLAGRGAEEACKCRDPGVGWLVDEVEGVEVDSVEQAMLVRVGEGEEEVRAHSERMVRVETLVTKITNIGEAVVGEGTITRVGRLGVAVVIRDRTEQADMKEGLISGRETGRLPRVLGAPVKKTRIDEPLRTSRSWGSRSVTYLGLGAYFRKS